MSTTTLSRNCYEIRTAHPWQLRSAPGMRILVFMLAVNGKGPSCPLTK
jgi:hypothetical protein